MRGIAYLSALLLASLGLSPTRTAGAPAPIVERPKTTATPSEPSDDAPVATDGDVVVPAKPLPATRYASMSTDECMAELDARRIEHAPASRPRPSIETPIKIGATLSGIRFRTLVTEPARERSPYEVMDCRLALALDDFAKILRRHDIIDVMYFSAFRPPVPGVDIRGHERALAIDIAFFGRKDGSAYSILRDFTPIPNERPCQPRIRASGPRELRALVCEAVAEGIFHVALTPDYDAAHRDHFHLEIVPEATTAYAR